MDSNANDAAQDKGMEKVLEALDGNKEEACFEAFFLTFDEDNKDIKA